jgi:hypothetical protein
VRPVAAAQTISDVPDPQSDPAQKTQQQFVYPYAAVPVQGGWLVFQL